MSELIALELGRVAHLELANPPLNLFTDAALIGAHADATLLVARADRTERQALRFAVLQLQHVQANLAGAILNGVDLGRN